MKFIHKGHGPWKAGLAWFLTFQLVLMWSYTTGFFSWKREQLCPMDTFFRFFLKIFCSKQLLCVRLQCDSVKFECCHFCYREFRNNIELYCSIDLSSDSFLLPPLSACYNCIGHGPVDFPSSPSNNCIGHERCHDFENIILWNVDPNLTKDEPVI